MRLRRPGCLITTSALLALVSGAACSTLETGPVPECKTDADCGTGLVCSLDTASCVPEELPPRQVLGFDIIEGAAALEIRTEIHGCDPEVSRELGGSELRVVKKGQLFETLDVSVGEAKAVAVSCGGGVCEGGICDPDTLTCTTPIEANVDLRMASRLGLDPVASPSKTYVTETDPPLEEGELPPPVALTWPSYSTTTPTAFPAAQLRVTPAGESMTRSEFRLALGTDAGTELAATGLERCMRGIIGAETSVRTLAGVGLADAGVQFIFDEPIATPSTVLGLGAACSSDEDCALGWACDPSSQRCGLDLTGVIAGATTSQADPAGSFPTARIYSYCGDSNPEAAVERQLRVRVKPPDSSGWPTMEYELVQVFSPKQPNTLGEVSLANGLCLPNWAEPQPVSFTLSGDPVPLLESELGTYACCSTNCLPSPEAEEPAAPPMVETCTDFESVGFETLWFNEEPISWAVAKCMTTVGPGRYYRSVSSNDQDEACTDEGCTISLTAGDPMDEAIRLYTVSIEQPPESVFRSQRLNVTMTPETSSFPTFELEPRILVRGSLACADPMDCSVSNAVVAAEQIRTDTPDSEISGPYFFDTRVDANGEFVLPVDPGVYVMTAYPAISEPGAPSRYRVVDLRDGAPEIDLVDGVPTVSLAPFELEDGVLVRVQLRDFNFSTKVTPLDTGSWAYQDDFPPEVDLNDPQTCLTSTTRGCTIRRVRPTPTGLPLQLSGQFQFTARDRGPASCPE